MAKKPFGHNSGQPDQDVGQRLLQYIESIETLEIEKKEIATHIKEKFSEAASTGFDTAVMKAIIKRRKIPKDKRREQDALLQVYLAAIGDLDGTPLGTHAIKKLMGDDDSNDIYKPLNLNEAPSPDTPDAPVVPAETAEQAHARGAADAKVGKQVLENPYPPYSALRSAWDEGWCSTIGSNGLEIPKSLQRKEDAKSEKPEAGAHAKGMNGAGSEHSDEDHGGANP
jgi:uncharacterized protein (UPF0335 family)